MSFFGYAIETLASFGFYDFFLPWLLVLAVVFGLLQKKQYISDQVSVNAAIAISISFLGTVVLHSFFVRVFTYFGIALAGLLILIIFAAMFDLKPNEIIKDMRQWNKNAVPGLVMLSAILVFLFALGFGVGDLLGLLYNPIVAVIAIFVILAIVVTFITGGGHGNGGSGEHQ